MNDMDDIVTYRGGIETHTGRFFDPHRPRMADVCIEDIAHALACVNRFGGHAPKPYSVAQHSYLVSKMLPGEFALQGLLHDAHEAYVGDMPSPIKHQLPDFREMDDKVLRVVRARFGLPAQLAACVHAVDVRLLTTEAKAFGLSWWNWPQFANHPPFAELAKLEPWPWAKAKQRFLDRFRALTGGA